MIIFITFKTNQMDVPTQIHCNAVYFLNSMKANASNKNYYFRSFLGKQWVWLW